MSVYYDESTNAYYTKEASCCKCAKFKTMLFWQRIFPIRVITQELAPRQVDRIRQIRGRPDLSKEQKESHINKIFTKYRQEPIPAYIDRFFCEECYHDYKILSGMGLQSHNDYVIFNGKKRFVRFNSLINVVIACVPPRKAKRVNYDSFGTRTRKEAEPVSQNYIQVEYINEKNYLLGSDDDNIFLIGASKYQDLPTEPDFRSQKAASEEELNAVLTATPLTEAEERAILEEQDKARGLIE